MNPSSYLSQRPGCHERLKAALPLFKRVIRELTMDGDFWADTVGIADSTPLPCGMSRPTDQRSNMAGWAGYGYCASRPRRPAPVAARWERELGAQEVVHASAIDTLFS